MCKYTIITRTHSAPPGCTERTTFTLTRFGIALAGVRKTRGRREAFNPIDLIRLSFNGVVLQGLLNAIFWGQRPACSCCFAVSLRHPARTPGCGRSPPSSPPTPSPSPRSAGRHLAEGELCALSLSPRHRVEEFKSRNAGLRVSYALAALGRAPPGSHARRVIG